MNSNQSFSELLRTVLPDEIEVVGVTDPCVELALPRERELAHNMVTKRFNEFLTGRTCARRALRRLRIPDQPLLTEPSRAPRWPDGTLGSITHTEGYYAAAVGLTEDFFGIGIDVERSGRVTEKLESYIATPAESQRHRFRSDWRTIAFSTKESIFKCLNPPTGLWLDFHDVELLLIDGGRFEALVSPKELPSFQIAGAYAVHADFVLSAVVLRHDTPLREQLPQRFP